MRTFTCTSYVWFVLLATAFNSAVHSCYSVRFFIRILTRLLFLASFCVVTVLFRGWLAPRLIFLRCLDSHRCLRWTSLLGYNRPSFRFDLLTFVFALDISCYASLSQTSNAVPVLFLTHFFLERRYKRTALFYFCLAPSAACVSLFLRRAFVCFAQSMLSPHTIKHYSDHHAVRLLFRIEHPWSVFMRACRYFTPLQHSLLLCAVLPRLINFVRFASRRCALRVSPLRCNCPFSDLTCSRLRFLTHCRICILFILTSNYCSCLRSLYAHFSFFFAFVWLIDFVLALSRAISHSFCLSACVSRS